MRDLSGGGGGTPAAGGDTALDLLRLLMPEALPLGFDGDPAEEPTAQALPLPALSLYSYQGSPTIAPLLLVPAGGAPTVRMVFGTAEDFGVYVGSGVPTVKAGKGSLYLRTDGTSTSTRAYINTDGGVTWTAITTAA